MTWPDQDGASNPLMTTNEDDMWMQYDAFFQQPLHSGGFNASSQQG